jgi:serine/threonine-protein kinase RsbW
MSEAVAERQLIARMPSQIGEVSAACRQARDMLDKHQLPHCVFNVELVLRECLNNAILHGNLQDPAKTTTLKMTIGRKWICLRVADEGAGFDWRKLRRNRLTPRDCGGRGLGIILLYSHRVAHNIKGNEIAVWMNKEQTKTKRHE